MNRLTKTGTQALVRSGSPNSSLSADDGASITPICRAIALLDSSNFSFEKEALKFKVKLAKLLFWLIEKQKFRVGKGMKKVCSSLDRTNFWF